ncbi:hypothetical protein PZA20_13640 [Pectobacterium polaris]|uniref:P-loop NTPase fold protein n=1 Tax=Pectobacterium polaris TaxID=2042057 RepID=UPI0023B17548|nr:P-loop NTPase fold protein [Pectobacterium polaris]MDE8742856.1 hypothetical protein [Pectobacterium polaris]
MSNLEFFHEYINYYKGLENPGYAVLITGEWGAGKTYQIKKALTEDEMYYVSLFDVTSTDDIYSSVFYKMSPKKAFMKGAAGAVGDTSVGNDALTFGLGGLVGKVVNAIIKEDIKTDRILVFDDLERCTINTNQILGVINKYVEHHKCKVIVIAHDIKLTDVFSQTKEKIIGQTINIEPNIEEAFEHFLKDEEFSNIHRIVKNTIKNIFLSSNCRSLRILKHTIRDCSRLYKCLNKEHIDNEPAIEELFSSFSSLAISYRHDKLKKEDLTNRISDGVKYYLNKVKEEKPLLVKLDEMYKKNNISIDYSRLMLSDDILINCLFNGYYNQKDIISNLDKNFYFSHPEEIKPWLILMNFDDLDSDKINKAIEDMDVQIKNKKLTDIGDILHSFTFKFLISYIGITSMNFDEILEQGKKYALDLVKRDIFPLPDLENRFSSYRDRESSHGYGYWIKDEYRSHFNELSKYLEYCKKIALKRTYPKIKNELLDLLKNDVKSFAKLISSEYKGMGKYSSIDVLCSIKPHDFVNQWLQIPHSNWQMVKLGLQGRYSVNTLNNNLKSERVWIKQVINLLEYQASRKNGFDKYRIQRIIPKSG